MSGEINKINPTVLNKGTNYYQKGENVCLRILEIDADNYHLLRLGQERCLTVGGWAGEMQVQDRGWEAQVSPAQLGRVSTQVCGSPAAHLVHVGHKSGAPQMPRTWLPQASQARSPKKPAAGEQVDLRDEESIQPPVERKGRFRKHRGKLKKK